MPKGLLLLLSKIERGKTRVPATCRLQVSPKGHALRGGNAERFLFDKAAQVGIRQQSVVQLESSRLLREPGHALFDQIFTTANHCSNASGSNKIASCGSSHWDAAR